MEGQIEEQGVVACGKWIKRPENVNLIILGRVLSPKSTLQIFSYDPKTTSLSLSPLTAHEIEDGEPVSIAVHPNGEEIVCATSTGDCKMLLSLNASNVVIASSLYQVPNSICSGLNRLFELCVHEMDVKLLAKETPLLQGVGKQNCLDFSVDGTKLAAGGEDGHLRIFEWPSLRIILDEPKAHKSVRDMDFSLDSEFLASTSTDGSARVWNANEGVPITTLRRNPDEKIELCCFSKDGTKPFLFCTVQKGKKSLTDVWDISTWKKIGYKQLLKKPASILSTSLDGKYLALGSKDGDFCVVEVKKMQASHWSKRLHPGTSIVSLEFCPSERVVLTTTKEWGAKVTKLSIVDWKEWQLYAFLLALFLASAIAFYIFYLLSDSFWDFPNPNQPTRPEMDTLLGESSEDLFGPLDL